MTPGRSVPFRLLGSSAFRLALVYMTLFSASVLILLGFIYWSTAAYMAQQTDATIEAEIQGLAERYQIQGLSGLTRVIEQRLSRKPTGSSIYLLTTPGGTPLLGNLDRWPEVDPDNEGWLNFRLEGAGEDETDIHLARARPFTLSGGFHLLVGRDIHDLVRIKRTIIRALAWGLGFTLVLGGIGGVMMSRSITRQIESINATSREIMSGDLSRRIPVRGSGDDFDRLAGNLNAMLDRIQSLMEEVRRVSDNIAHDLRTPLARLRNRLEEMRAAAGSGNGIDPGEIEKVVAEADGLLTTFNALLRIARIEAEERREAFREVSVDELAADVAELYEPLAEEKGQKLSRDLERDIRLPGDRDLLFQALANLLDNAIKYTPEGGHVMIELRRVGENGARLVVADDGPGIPPEAREKVFQRFFRLEESRTTPGNGLGLSLVAAVARLHGFTLSLDDNRPGLRVILDLPRITA